MIPSAACTGCPTWLGWRPRHMATRRGGTAAIHGRLADVTANFLECPVGAFHTPESWFTACRRMGVQFGHSSLAQPRDAGRPVRIGNERAAGRRRRREPRGPLVAAPRLPATPSRRWGGAPRATVGRRALHVKLDTIDGKIHLRPPPILAVAPILHCSIAVAANRPTHNLNNGAADADGR